MKKAAIFIFIFFFGIFFSLSSCSNKRPDNIFKAKDNISIEKNNGKFLGNGDNPDNNDPDLTPTPDTNPNPSPSPNPNPNPNSNPSPSPNVSGECIKCNEGEIYSPERAMCIKSPGTVCATVMDPVCGCDGVGYSNPCVAKSVGRISSWTKDMTNCPNYGPNGSR